jgi:hypothetical protein
MIIIGSEPSVDNAISYDNRLWPDPVFIDNDVKLDLMYYRLARDGELHFGRLVIFAFLLPPRGLRGT